MKRLLVAVGFLTRLPVPPLAVSDGDFAAAMRWFPAAGLAVGATVAAAAWLGRAIDPWTGALAGLVAWVMITGALHLDGLGDLADARGAAHGDRARFLAVLADPHIGSFGVTAIGLQLVAKLVLVHAQASVLPLLLIPAAARVGPLVWTRLLPPLHPGLAARFARAVGRRHIAAWGVALLAGSWLWPPLLAAPILLALWAWWLKRAVGGVSGDCHGAGIELVETGLLLAGAIALRL